MRELLTVGLALVLLGVTPARGNWDGFYHSEEPAHPVPRSSMPLPDMTGMHPANVRSTRLGMIAPQAVALQPVYDAPVPDPTIGAEPCVAEILRAQDRYGIPGNILLGIGLQEAGVSREGRLTVWPWAVNAAGEGRIFDAPANALDWVRERQSAGIASIDVGCMQINLRWHPHAFSTLEQGFEPFVNVDYAARFLVGLHSETGDWMRAAGAYHSRTPDLANVYLASLKRNVAVANDRIDSFRTRAVERGTAAMHAGENDKDAPGTHPVAPWNHGHWSTQRGDSGGVYGIYSRDQLEPVLPQFTHYF